MKEEKTKATQAYKRSNVAPIFGIVKQGKAYKIVMGNYLVSMKEFKSIKDAEDYIGTRPWDLIYTTILISIEYADKIQKDPENDKKVSEDSKEN